MAPALLAPALTAMPLTLNSNLSATFARDNLSLTNGQLQRSLNRLSSGSKIVKPSDDAGGLAVSTTLTSTIKRQSAANANIGNAISFLQTQDGALQTAGKIIDRISELKTLNGDITKNLNDRANYLTEFQQLQAQLAGLAGESFNGKNLFGTDALNVLADSEESAASAVNLGGVNLLGTGGALSLNETFPGSALSGNWTEIPNGGAQVVVSGGSATLAGLDMGGGSRNFSLLQLNSEFNTPVTLSFDFQSTDTINTYVGIEKYNTDDSFNGMFGEILPSDILDTNSHTIAMTLNPDGTISGATLDGGPNDYVTGVFQNATAGDFKLVIAGDSIVISNLNISSASGGAGNQVGGLSTASDLESLSLTSINAALEEVAGFRAANGAQQSRLQFASEQLTTNQVNLEAANSRIVDVDVATESTQLARFNILAQAGASMLQQANQSPSLALRLLG